MEKHETVDHIDCNFSNDVLSNLRVVERSQHIKEDVKRNKPVKFHCFVCSENFTLSGNRLSRAKSNRKRGKVGPFCSRKCAGVYGKMVQTKNLSRLEPVIIKDRYTTLKETERS